MVVSCFHPTPRHEPGSTAASAVDAAEKQGHVASKEKWGVPEPCPADVPPSEALWPMGKICLVRLACSLCSCRALMMPFVAGRQPDH